MFKIQTLNSISDEINKALDAENFSIANEVDSPDGIILRSFNMHEMELDSNIKAIARAGAGVNNIPVESCTEKGIVVFNSPGANANAVKELVLCTMLMATRNVLESIAWTNSLSGGGDSVVKDVEKGKGAFVGHELKGKTIGIIGLGAIGSKLADTCIALGMQVVGCDPYLTVPTALGLSSSIKVVASEKEVIKDADFISVHVPLTAETRDKFNDEFIANCKEGVIILNMSRAELADAEAIKSGIASGKIAKYVVDFPTDNLIGEKNVILTPHLASGTYEAEDNCAIMASQELRDYLMNGNITNSVNFPACSLGALSTTARLCVIHKNQPTIINKITGQVSQNHINIDNMISKNRGEYAYTMLDICDILSEEMIENLKIIDGVVMLREIIK